MQIQKYINKFKKNRVIWTLDAVYVGNFYFIIALQYTYICLKTANLIGFR